MMQELLDTRVRKTVFPVRVIECRGRVTGAERLTVARDMQIGLEEQDCTVLENTETEEASILLDFGREMNGCVRILTFLTGSDQPARVRIVCGESVSEAQSDIGQKNATNDHAVRDFEQLLPSRSDTTTNETGFRFVMLRLLGKNATLSLRAVTAVAVYRDLPYLGTFSCSDGLLNRIYDTAAYTCHQCLQQYVWDGIKRDRLVWMGDMHPEMLAIRTVFGALPVVRDTLAYIRDTSPLPGWMNYYPTYSLWWLMNVRDWYFYTGSEDFLRENSAYFLALTEQTLQAVGNDGSDSLPVYFLDWPTNGTEAGRQGSRALLVWVLRAAAEVCRHLGEATQAERCDAKIAALQKAGFSWEGRKQVAAIAALAGCTDEDEAAERILCDGARGFSVFMSYYLLKVGAKHDMTAALNALRQYFGGMLSMGATTFWEDFDLDWMQNATPIDMPVSEGKSDIHGDNGAFCYRGLRHSLCHGWSSSPTAFLAEEVLGIRIAALGCRRMELSPKLGDLQWAKGSYPTPLGVLTVECRREADGSVRTVWDAPVGMEVVLC